MSRLDYKVGGVDQNQVTASDSFTVDRKVNLTRRREWQRRPACRRASWPAVTAFTVTNSPTLRSISRSPRLS
jgi:hypothetical protein